MMHQIVNGRVLSGEGFADTAITFTDGVITADRGTGPSIDADGLLVLPGIVDIHGDAFERQIQPRPKVGFPLDIALRETDNQLIANGITTAYHGLTVSWEPGLRSVATARIFVESLARLRPTLACDTRLHIRWETFALDALDEVLTWLGDEDTPIFAFNDHTTGLLSDTVQRRKIGTMAARSGLTLEDFQTLVDDVWARRDEVPDAIASAAERARAAGAVLLAHDEMSPEQRSRFRALGAVVSEFPMNEATAKAAREAGEHTILGAPNVVRGGSHNGAMNAAPAVAAGLCSVLTSDYYYPSPLLAPFLLAADHGIPLADAWNLVSKNAAEAAQLHDRGTLAPGKRADIVLVDDADPRAPQVVCCFVNGRKVFDRRPFQRLSA